MNRLEVLRSGEEALPMTMMPMLFAHDVSQSQGFGISVVLLYRLGTDTGAIGLLKS